MEEEAEAIENQDLDDEEEAEEPSQTGGQEEAPKAETEEEAPNDTPKTDDL